MPPTYLEDIAAKPLLSGDGEHSNFVLWPSPAMRSVERVIANLAATDISVLIVGEHGTGKRTAALQIHRVSARREEALLYLACAAVSPQSFNGRKNGKSQQNLPQILADAGTIVFEEIRELSSGCQLKLMQLLDQRERATLSLPRLIATAKKSLDAEISGGRFREDLYYRLSGVCLHMPSLRQRKEDIPLLMKFFLGKYATMFVRPEPRLSEETEGAFLSYSWPGNIRELENVARAIVATGDETVAVTALRGPGTKRPSRVAVPQNLSLKQAARAASRHAERELILKALSRTHWNRKHAAQELQISYKALLYKLKQIRMDGHSID